MRGERKMNESTPTVEISPVKYNEHSPNFTAGAVVYTESYSFDDMDDDPKKRIRGIEFTALESSEINEEDFKKVREQRSVPLQLKKETAFLVKILGTPNPQQKVVKADPDCLVATYQLVLSNMREDAIKAYQDLGWDVRERGGF